MHFPSVNHMECNENDTGLSVFSSCVLIGARAMMYGGCDMSKTVIRSNDERVACCEHECQSRMIEENPSVRNDQNSIDAKSSLAKSKHTNKHFPPPHHQNSPRESNTTLHDGSIKGENDMVSTVCGERKQATAFSASTDSQCFEQHRSHRCSSSFSLSFPRFVKSQGVALAQPSPQ